MFVYVNSIQEHMIKILIEMYISLLPAIFSGIFNMVWCKSPFGGLLKKPMDAGRNLKDGKRIFGDNKTWKGFFGMIVLGCIFTMIWGLICGNSGYLYEHNYLYANRRNTVLYNALMGILFGFAYAVCELPNSFIKRRLCIRPGKTASGFKKILFVFMDQADSVLGCVLVVCIVYRMTLGFYVAYVLVGAATHIILNIFLYSVKLRKNMF